MLMRETGVALISLTVVIAGMSKQTQMKKEVQSLKEYELALEQLRELICYEKMPLPQALRMAAQGRDTRIVTLFQKASDAIISFKDPAEKSVFIGHVLPIRSLVTPGQAQERILMKLTEEVRNDRLQRENKLEERCRSCMSVAVALSAICAIVLL